MAGSMPLSKPDRGGDTKVGKIRCDIFETLCHYKHKKLLKSHRSTTSMYSLFQVG